MPPEETNLTDAFRIFLNDEEIKHSKMKLRVEYNNVCDKYAEEFAKKHDLEFDFWISSGKQQGGLASFSQSYYITIDNIRLDIDNDVPKMEIMKWYDSCISHAYTCQGELNYFSYLMANGLLKVD